MGEMLKQQGLTVAPTLIHEVRMFLHDIKTLHFSHIFQVLIAPPAPTDEITRILVASQTFELPTSSFLAFILCFL
jgi:hypothetical protein